MTSLSPVTPAVLNSALDGLKRRNTGQKAFANYFLQRLDEVANLRMLESERSVCFLHDEWDFARFYFHTFDTAELGQTLQQASWPPIVVTDWISKVDPAFADQFLAQLGFHLHATYDRIVCKSIRRERPNVHICLASDGECDTIHALLFRVFDKYADHIIPVEELGRLIADKLVLVSHDPQGSIDGLVVFPVSGQNCNFNFLFSSRGALGLAHLLGNFYGVLTERGVQAGFSWVRRTRPMVLKLHESFGWKKDGLVDYIYLR